jgi:hypothetical protein
MHGSVHAYLQVRSAEGYQLAAGCPDNDGIAMVCEARNILRHNLRLFGGMGPVSNTLACNKTTLGAVYYWQRVGNPSFQRSLLVKREVEECVWEDHATSGYWNPPELAYNSDQTHTRRLPWCFRVSSPAASLPSAAAAVAVRNKVGRRTSLNTGQRKNDDLK